jgi:hypothetical protein
LELGGRATSNLLHTERSKFLLGFIEELDKFSLVLVTEFVSLDGSLSIHRSKYTISLFAPAIIGHESSASTFEKHKCTQIRSLQNGETWRIS